MRILVKTTILLVSAVLCGCSSNSKDNVKDYYMLEATRGLTAPTPASKQSDFILIVDKFAVAEGFGNTSFIYRNSKGLYESDYYRRFFTDKGTMLSNITSQWLSDSEIFKFVTISKAGVSGKYRIKGLINEMYADMSNPANLVAKLKVKVFVVDQSGQVVFSDAYNVNSPIKEATAKAVIEATNNCVQQYLTALEADLSKAKL